MVSVAHTKGAYRATANVRTVGIAGPARGFEEEIDIDCLYDGTQLCLTDRRDAITFDPVPADGNWEDEIRVTCKGPSVGWATVAVSQPEVAAVALGGRKWDESIAFTAHVKEGDRECFVITTLLSSPDMLLRASLKGAGMAGTAVMEPEQTTDDF